MKTTILQEHLIKLLSRVNKIITPKTHLPVLSTILLETHDGQLKGTATSPESTIIVLANAKVDKEGGVCVPAKTILEFVASLPQDKVVMEEKDGHLTMVCNGYRASIPCMAKEEFPPVVTKGKHGVKIAKESALDAIRAVSYAAATDEGRPILTGVRITGKDKETTLVATDGYRLSLKTIRTEQNTDLSATIPARALIEAGHIGDEEKEEKTITLSPVVDGQIGIFVADTEIYARALDGEYPNYEKIIPRSFTTSAVVDKEQFLRAVKSASIFARDNANIVKIHFENDEITIAANAPQTGENTVTMGAKTKGDAGDIAFNSRFLLEYLNNLPEDQFVFEMTGSLNPGAFRPVGDESALHIIMPVRVQS